MESNIELIQTINEYIPKLKEGIFTAVKAFEEGDMKNASGIVIEFSEGIEWLLSALLLIKDTIKETIDINEINEKLSEIVEAFENEDFILVGDLLQYEIIPILDQVYNKINIDN